jgi:hypothetical protein
LQNLVQRFRQRGDCMFVDVADAHMLAAQQTRHAGGVDNVGSVMGLSPQPLPKATSSA